MLIGGRSNGQACADGERDPHWPERKLDNVGWIYWRKLNLDSHSFSFDRFFLLNISKALFQFMTRTYQITNQ
jgi:hypothetical protein